MSHYTWARGSMPRRLITGTLVMRVACEARGAAVLVLFMFLFPARGWAAAYGTVSGIVRDDNDRPVAEAKGSAVLPGRACGLPYFGGSKAWRTATKNLDQEGHAC